MTTICKILEKRYDAPTEGWVLVDIIEGDEFYQDNEETPHIARGEIFGWAPKEMVDAELERTGYEVKCPLMDCGDQDLIHYVSRYIIPFEWQRDFFTCKENQDRVFYCVKGE